MSLKKKFTDKERLDWLTKNRSSVTPMMAKWILRYDCTGMAHAASNPRKAIDAAMLRDLSAPPTGG